MKKLLTTLCALLLCSPLFAQGGLHGTVTDAGNHPITNATVKLTRGGRPQANVLTDFDGKYSIAPLLAGTYEATVSYTGFQKDSVSGIVVTEAGSTQLNFRLVSSRAATEIAVDDLSAARSVATAGVHVRRYERPLIEPKQPGSRTVLTEKEIEKMPTRNPLDATSTSPGVYQGRSGQRVSIAGGRSENTVYVIDGAQQAKSPSPRGRRGQREDKRAYEQQVVVQHAPPYPTEPVPHAKPQYLNPSTERYARISENDFHDARTNPLSTLSVDVDRASYANVRRFINDGVRPPADAVRIEEMVNYFDYDYEGPRGTDPVAIHTEVADCPWNPAHKILHIGLQARRIDERKLPPSNLVFLIDVSGSMNEPAKLPLVQSSLRMLVNNLRREDRVAIVVYAGSAGLVLPSTSGTDKPKILGAIDNLKAGGSTAGGAGILLAYKTAKENFIRGGNNRVILATDGDFNVGVSQANELEDLIVKQREGGVFLTVLGYGTGNYQDEKMQILADKGNGNHAYIDNLQEAQKVLVGEFGGTLFTIAKDVKAQVEFNPARVQGYRLIGYENRLLAEEDFKDDKKDAGEIGAGHTVTILYEIIPAGTRSRSLRRADPLRYGAPGVVAQRGLSSELATVKFRYKQPDGYVSKELMHPIADNGQEMQQASENMRWASAVALAGMLLRDSKFVEKGDFNTVLSLGDGARGRDEEGYRAEFLRLVRMVPGEWVSRR